MNAPTDFVRLIKCDEARAHEAWEAHRAMVLAEIRQPALKDNATWTVLRETAMTDFLRAFEEVCK